MKMSLILAVLLVAFALTAVGAADLPVQQVVLFSSGVGHFQRGGQIEGDAIVEMSFDADQINDILKSMTIQDLGEGAVGAVTYAPQDPLSHTLKSFAVDVVSNDTLAELLGSLVGETIRASIGKETIEGTIVGVESRQVAEGETTVEVSVLNLLTKDGLRQLQIPTIKSMSLTEQALSSDMEKALSAIADARDRDKRGVNIAFHGEGKREALISYLLETPVWKTSYRLLADKEKGFLQGWAIVENTTDSDWENVDLSLISGQPISFVSNLYQPIYVDRPVVQPEVATGIGPQVYGGAVEEEMAKEGAPPPAPAAEAAEEPRRMRAFMKAAPAGRGGAADEMTLEDVGVQAQAEAGKVGELFQYAIDRPVTIPRQRSAMIPIVNQDIESKKVSIYNAGVNETNPLNGLRLKNSTELHLMGGPITVFEDGVYAGDAMITDLPPADKRLIAYAVDLAVRVDPKSESAPAGQQVALKIVNGVLHMSRKLHQETVYTIKNTADEGRTVVVEHPIRKGWELIEPDEADERTSELYRFDVEVEAGAEKTFKVVQERQLSETAALTRAEPDQIEMWISDVKLSDAMVDALQKIKQLQANIADLQTEVRNTSDQLEWIEKEQARIRQNMAELDHDSDLYQQYVDKFAEQEKQFETLRAQLDDLNQKEQAAQRELRDYVNGLDIQ